jgi:hypothetical protein
MFTIEINVNANERSDRNNEISKTVIYLEGLQIESQGCNQADRGGWLVFDKYQRKPQAIQTSL